MAELILTEEEKAQKWSEVSDYLIGKMMKKSLFKFEEEADIDAEDGKDAWYIKLGLLMYANKLAETNVDEATVTFRGISDGNVKGGDWLITWKRLDEDAPEEPRAPAEETYLNVHVVADNIPPGDRLSTAWGLLRSSCSALFKGRLDMWITKYMKIPEMSQGRL